MNLKRKIIFLLVFFSGFANLAVEIIAPRMLASFFGATTISWAIIISITLLGISAGYFIGGQLSNQKASMQIIPKILIINAIWLTTVSFLIWELLNKIGSFGVEMLFIVSIVTFFIPSMLFGMITPLAIKLLLQDDSQSVVTVGNVYAISTIGSVSGALAAAFYLIPWVGLSSSLRGISLLLVAFSFYFIQRKSIAVACFALCIITPNAAQEWASPLKLLTQTEGYYQTIRVYTDEKNFIRFHLGPTFESEVDIKTGEPGFDYARTMVDLVQKPEGSQILIIGGAGHSQARTLEGKGANITEVEIDPIVIEVSNQYFGPINGEVVIQDGRAYVETAGPDLFDYVLIDAFSGPASIPPQLTTLEFFSRISRVLKPNGVLIYNSIGKPSGFGSQSFMAMSATLSEVFSDVRLSERDGNGNQSLIFVASNNDAGYSLERVPTGGPILTDDLNPIEMYTLLSLMGE